MQKTGLCFDFGDETLEYVIYTALEQITEP